MSDNDELGAPAEGMTARETRVRQRALARNEPRIVRPQERSMDDAVEVARNQPHVSLVETDPPGGGREDLSEGEEGPRPPPPPMPLALGRGAETIEMKLARLERQLEQMDRMATEATQGVVVEIEEPERETARLTRIHQRIHDAHIFAAGALHELVGLERVITGEDQALLQRWRQLKDSVQQLRVLSNGVAPTIHQRWTVQMELGARSETERRTRSRGEESNLHGQRDNTRGGDRSLSDNGRFSAEANLLDPRSSVKISFAAVHEDDHDPISFFRDVENAFDRATNFAETQGADTSLSDSTKVKFVMSILRSSKALRNAEATLAELTSDQRSDYELFKTFVFATFTSGTHVLDELDAFETWNWPMGTHLAQVVQEKMASRLRITQMAKLMTSTLTTTVRYRCQQVVKYVSMYAKVKETIIAFQQVPIQVGDARISDVETAMVEDQRRHKVELQRRLNCDDDGLLEELAFQAAAKDAIDALVKKADEAYAAMGGMNGARGGDRAYGARPAMRAPPSLLMAMDEGHASQLMDHAGVQGQSTIAAMAVPTERNQPRRGSRGTQVKCFLCMGDHGYAQCARPLSSNDIDAAVKRASEGPRGIQIPVKDHLKSRTKEGVMEAIKAARREYYASWKRNSRWRSAANQVARIRALDAVDVADDDEHADDVLELLLAMQEMWEPEGQLFASE